MRYNNRKVNVVYAFFARSVRSHHVTTVSWLETYMRINIRKRNRVQIDGQEFLAAFQTNVAKRTHNICALQQYTTDRMFALIGML